MRIDFDEFENGNASIEVDKATPGEYHIRTRLGAAYITFYANDAELRLLRAKLNDLLP